MNNKRATVKDVAAEAHVTAQTVSRVFRNKGYVSAATRSAVVAAAEKLGYVPNTAAIQLRMGKAQSIAVVFDSLINIYFAVIVNHLHEQLTQRGYQLQTLFVKTSHITEDVYRTAVSQGAAGVISFLEPQHGLGEVVKHYGVPLLIFGRSTTQSQIDYICTDDFAGGTMAAQLLLDQGCNTFAYLADGLGITCIDQRNHGFASYLAQHGKGSIVVDSVTDDQTMVNNLFVDGKMVEGVFCSGDMVAYRLLSALKQRKIKGVQVVGFDNIQADLPLYSAINSIGISKHVYVKHAVDKLLAKVEHSLVDRVEEMLPVQLFQGAAAN